MQFTITLTLLAATLAAGADIARTTGNNCSGNKIICKGIQENNCCKLGANTRQVFYSLPDNSRGNAFSGGNCDGNFFSFRNEKKAERCITFSNPVNAGRWLVGLGKRGESLDGGESEQCVEPNAASFELDGETHEVEIPEGKAAEVESWMENGEWEKLTGLKRV
ncbi:hypothetical protein K402DRAFT_417784 [Aulographum hederae CBS 113979]|uniref:Uncharacterized protein n=1 Tax=Aulographum hederae CBS 113979 TaxID=1176131 RepID=A0A6G1HB00_9PEZI|nr:hypothetical protein K402DRAFT_417784 [Aulographum hederae CBS 113979]